MQWSPEDGCPIDMQVDQFKKMLKLYYKIREVGGDPVNHDDQQ